MSDAREGRSSGLKGLRQSPSAKVMLAERTRGRRGMNEERRIPGRRRGETDSRMRWFGKEVWEGGHVSAVFVIMI
jgi:hypothetical protein